MFERVNSKESFPGREEKILRFWKENQIFAKSCEARRESPLFTFYDGPPFATGLPHYGHLLVSAIKDIVLRYKTMQGYYVPRRFGWDCHGLPVEQEIEKAKGLTGAAQIDKFGIANFNEECRSIVLRYTNEWRSIVERMGRWVDFSHTYKTMDRDFMESVWWVFSELYKKGLIYEGFRVMPYSAKLGTPLSNFEAQENYKDVDDPSLTVTFPLRGQENTYFLVWTTTPWTLISNLAIAAGADIDYVKIYHKPTGRYYILAQARLEANFKDPTEFDIVEHIPGGKLEGIEYEPLFPHFHYMREKGAFRVIVDGFVTLEDGTGLVHTAPGFGEADFFACQARGIPVVCPVGQNGEFLPEIAEYAGRFVKDCDKDIIRRLKGEGHVFHHETCHHRYPFCWRSDTPLIYKACATWFVAVEKIKDAILRANDKINWVPEHIKYGRFGKWLENARDWNISRNRYWGTPIPIWQAEDGEIRVIGSLAELEAKTGAKVADLHRHFIDHLTFTENGKLFRRIPEVFDCWFESGSMPYAQNHYPFENRELFEKSYPADFIAESIDQTRGWFYTLTILAAALYDKPAFLNGVVSGLILAEDGAKMSKRLRNYPDPEEVIKTWGADALRLYMMASPVVRADDLCFSKAGVEGVLRGTLIPLQNAYSFFITYARLYNWKPDDTITSFTPQFGLDKWILSLLQKLVYDVEKAMEHYDLKEAVEPLAAFIDRLTNWYIRRSRRRFWNDDDTSDRRDAFRTLYVVLHTFMQVAAPFIPFMTEAIFRNLRRESDPESVHLAQFPLYEARLRDESLEESMELVQKAASLGHSLRKSNELKVRQPLASAYIVSKNPRHLELLEREKEIIRDELNVEEVVFSSNEEQFVTLRAKPNFRVLGKKIGKLMKEAHTRISAFSTAELAQIAIGEPVTVTIGGQEVTLTAADVDVEREVKGDLVALNDGEITVALDTHLTEALIRQGIAREVVNKINTMRKEADFDISDRIHVVMKTTKEIEEAVRQHEATIAAEILSLSIAFHDCSGTEWELNGAPTVIAITKAGS
jgi:isoleucyl-tRNA synthetase